MQSILSRYAQAPANTELVFKTLCDLISQKPASLDWSAFGEGEWLLLGKMAAAEGVAQMAYHVLTKDPELYQLSSFDPDIYQLFAAAEARTAVGNALLFKQLDRILFTLTQADIPVVLIKGTHLAHALYPHPGLRSMADLDILVPQTNFKQALHLVGTLGYHEYLPQALPGLDQLISHHAHLRKTTPPATLLELHKDLVASPAFRHAVSLEWFWQNLEPCCHCQAKLPPSSANTVFTLSPTANLLYLSAHLMLQHGGENASLIWLLDLHQLIEQQADSIDWASLISQAELFAWGSALRLALQAIQDTFATTIPEGVIPELLSQSSPHDQLVNDKAAEAPTHILEEWRKIKSLNPLGQFSLILALLAPSPAYMRARYRPHPTWTWPFYYPYRWLWIAKDAWQTLRHILQNSPSKP